MMDPSSGSSSGAGFGQSGHGAWSRLRKFPEKETVKRKTFEAEAKISIRSRLRSGFGRSGVGAASRELPEPSPENSRSQSRSREFFFSHHCI